MVSHWTLEDIDWSRFDAAKVDPETLKAVKTASLVEFNATDYVRYMIGFLGTDKAFADEITRWGAEEIQHGQALAQWAERADSSFDFADAMKRFRAGYQLPLEASSSVRGSKAGEMIARCVIESGTSSYYSAIRDGAEEPVLRQIAAFIAADEFRHYRLFYETFLNFQLGERRHFFDRLRVALARIQEAEDDELAYAYYCANVPACDVERIPYERERFSREYNQRVLRFYRPEHIRKAVAMVAKAVGVSPQGPFARLAANLLWRTMQARGRAYAAAP